MLTRVLPGHRHWVESNVVIRFKEKYFIDEIQYAYKSILLLISARFYYPLYDRQFTARKRLSHTLLLMMIPSYRYGSLIWNLKQLVIQFDLCFLFKIGNLDLFHIQKNVRMKYCIFVLLRSLPLSVKFYIYGTHNYTTLIKSNVKKWISKWGNSWSAIYIQIMIIALIL